ncbi:hypothetical protein [Candidatus Caldatribacterium sp.]|uniref:hypothetical protein n=1 Tax=Candidatus Caldatribacterium sp. TaxID=2282143 RepID=UPI003872E669
MSQVFFVMLLSLWIASVAVAFLVAFFLSRRYGVRVFFVVPALTGVGGPLGFLLSLLLLGVLQTRGSGSLPFEVFASETMLFETFRGRRLGEGGALIARPDVAVYLSRNVNPLSLTRLRHFIFSQEEETRLVAFTTLHRMENSLSSEVDRLLRELATTEGEKRFAVLATLAELYSEFVFLGLADKELEDFYLRTAERYAEEALTLRESGKHCYLLGRILLRRGEAKRAEQYLTLAIQSGFPKERVVPYLLECAYMRRDFAQIVSMARLARDLCFVDQRAWSIVMFWAGGERSHGCCR